MGLLEEMVKHRCLEAEELTKVTGGKVKATRLAFTKQVRPRTSSVASRSAPPPGNFEPYKAIIRVMGLGWLWLSLCYPQPPCPQKGLTFEAVTDFVNSVVEPRAANRTRKADGRNPD